ncbi:hypothetical protein PMAYCL1PPCAC_00566, partial [Pristionchus mayeri]
MFAADVPLTVVHHIFQISEVSPDYLHVNTLLAKMAGVTRVQKMFEQTTERVKSQRLKWSSMSLYDPELRPTRGFIESLNVGFKNTYDPNVPKALAVRRLVVSPVTQTNGLAGNTLMTLLAAEIGNAKTRCFD